MALDEEDSKTLATACMNVLKHYNIKASQKAIDWGNLLLTGGLMYGGKMMAVGERKDAEKKARHAAATEGARTFGLQ